MGEIADAAYIAYQKALQQAQADGNAANMARLSQAAELSRQMNALEQASWNKAPAAAAAPASSPSNPAPTSYSPSPPPPPPAPLLPTFKPMLSGETSVRVAPSDIIEFDESSVSVAMMQDLLFEDVGAVELANISRSDLIDGQPTIYSPIKNLSSVRREFNPNTIVATAYNADYFTRFGIDLFARGINEPYFDENGDLVIEVDRVLADEEIQVQILANGTINTIEES